MMQMPYMLLRLVHKESEINTKPGIAPKSASGTSHGPTRQCPGSLPISHRHNPVHDYVRNPGRLQLGIVIARRRTDG